MNLNSNTNIPVSTGNVDSSYQAACVVTLATAFAGRRYVAGGFCKSAAFALEALKKNSAAAEWHKAGDAYLSSAKKNFFNDAKIALLAGAAVGATLYAKDNFSFGDEDQQEQIDGSQGQSQKPNRESNSTSGANSSVTEDGILWSMCKESSLCKDSVYPFGEGTYDFGGRVLKGAYDVYKDVSDSVRDIARDAFIFVSKPVVDFAWEHPVPATGIGGYAAYKLRSYFMGPVPPAVVTANANQVQELSTSLQELRLQLGDITQGAFDQVVQNVQALQQRIGTLATNDALLELTQVVHDELGATPSNDDVKALQKALQAIQQIVKGLQDAAAAANPTG